MLVSEEKLAIEVAEVDRVKVDDMNLAKACKDKILEELAANAACADKENTGL